MSVYCRPVVVDDGPEHTKIRCFCGLEWDLPHRAARRCYYDHNPNSEPIPMPNPARVVTGRGAPTAAELAAMDAEHRATRVELRGQTRRTFPDARERAVSRCPSCGNWQWKGFCYVDGCWLGHTAEVSAHVAIAFAQMDAIEATKQGAAA